MGRSDGRMRRRAARCLTDGRRHRRRSGVRRARGRRNGASARRGRTRRGGARRDDVVVCRRDAAELAAHGHRRRDVLDRRRRTGPGRVPAIEGAVRARGLGLAGAVGGTIRADDDLAGGRVRSDVVTRRDAFVDDHRPPARRVDTGVAAIGIRGRRRP